MLDDAYQDSTDAALTDLAQRPRPPKPQAPAFSVWGLVRAPDRGVRAGVAEAAGSAADFAGGVGDNVPAAISGPFGKLPFMAGIQAVSQTAMDMLKPKEGQFTSEVGTSFRNVARDLMPDPVTASGAEVAVAEFARLGSKAIASALVLGPVQGAVVAGAEEGFTTSDKLAQEGVDIETRSKVGAVTGVLNAVGFALPVAGKTVAQTVGLAVAGGPASFIGQQAVTREILSNAGYDKLADQYDPFDPVGLALSTVLPLGFGAMAMRSAAKAKAAAEPRPVVDEETVDAARVNLLRENAEATRLTPDDDMAGAQAHQDAIARALDQMAAGERVQVADVLPDVEAAGVRAAESLAARRIEPDPSPEQVPRDASLSQPDRLIEGRLAAKITEDFDAAAVEYAGRPDAMGGKVLNTDVARELSPEYLADRTKSAAVHEPASYFIKRLYEQRLAEIKPGDSVLFSSGGTGAGKTTGINSVPAARAMFEDAAIVYDTNMNKLASAVKKVEQALKAGAEVQIIHVQRDPVEALVQGALPRAARQAKEFGTGRTVPLKAHADTHRGSAEVIQQLAERYKDDPRVFIQVVDNTRGRNNAALADLEFVKGFDYNGVEGRLYEALKQQYDAGAIPESVFRATAGDADPGAGSVLRSDVRGQPQPQRDGGSGQGRTGQEAGGEGAGLTPEGAPNAQGVPVESAAVDTAARDLEAINPDLMVQLDGMEAPMRLADLMAEVRQSVADDLAEVPLIETAAACALRTGVQ